MKAEDGTTVIGQRTVGKAAPNDAPKKNEALDVSIHPWTPGRLPRFLYIWAEAALLCGSCP
ncbi:hypothetical protein A5N17_07930 [Arthrobacter sp. D2]|nr:hypothetical protein A5N13_14715 [Arthrobacter sp. D4]OEH63564.1 hypothetical protein A5N17_07930 [Arthrobacter sp. D2]QSZ51220.1 hypothetical protein AYX22_22000 [Arthrobacter sp. D5-1]